MILVIKFVFLYEMKKMKHSAYFLFTLIFFSGALMGQSGAVSAHKWSYPDEPAVCGPVPSLIQWRWQQMEYYAFIHYSINTYTDVAWGFGNEDPKLFNPAHLDCRQWARICKMAGMKGIIFTAKHHSGFCLWPSKFTDYSVKNIPWRNGQADIVRELADACKEYGLKFGIYLSPWDRNHAEYGKPEYIQYFRNQLRELLTNYGEIFEIWFDGANGGSGYYGGANETRKIDPKTYYDWQNTYKLVRALQPNIVIWNDGGDRADLRWVGTEAGYVGETNWSTLYGIGDVPEQMLRHGVENGTDWVPGEVNTSIRPEWFYHPKEDKKIKTLPQLMDIYYNSIGRNGTLLLNFPVMPNGLINEKDEQAALEFTNARKQAFQTNLAKNSKAVATQVRNQNSDYNESKAFDDNPDTYWTTNNEIKEASMDIYFDRPTSFNRFLIQEFIRLGQRVKSFELEAWTDGQWHKIAEATTIGYKRILRFPTVVTSQLRLHIKDSKCCPLISNIEIYNAPQILSPPEIIRDQGGYLHMTPGDPESEIYYTLDGEVPSNQSNKYVDSIATPDGKVEVRAISYNLWINKSSLPAEERFDISRKNWKIIGIEEKNVYNILDGNVLTNWHQSRNNKLPADLIIDLGKSETLTGFKYLPDQNWWAEASIISQYQIFVSDNLIDWKMVHEGEFANIKNNPTWQTIAMETIKTRYIKFRAIKTLQEGAAAGYAEIDVVTN